MIIPGNDVCIFNTNVAAAAGWGTYDQQHNPDLNTNLLLHAEDNAANATVTNSGTGGAGTANHNTSTMSIGGKFNLGFEFTPATTDFIAMDTEANYRIANNFTIEAYVYIYSYPTAPNNYNGIITKQTNLAGQPNYLLDLDHLTADKFRFVLFHGGYDVIYSDATPNLNQWIHIACQRSSVNGARTFVDGVLQAQTDATTTDCVTLGGNNQPLNIGIMDSGHLFYFDGIMDEIAVSSVLRY